MPDEHVILEYEIDGKTITAIDKGDGTFVIRDSDGEELVGQFCTTHTPEQHRWMMENDAPCT